MALQLRGTIMNPLAFAASATLLLAASASAGFSTPNVRVTSADAIGQQGQALRIYSVFVDFDAANPSAFTLLSVYNHSVTSGSMSGVLHADESASWNPLLTTSSIASIDSFVTISGLTGSGAGTALDPNFGDGLGSTIPNLAGWYDATPQTAIVGASIKVMQIALAAEDAGFTASLRVGYKVSGTTSARFSDVGYSIGSVVPAPGALALLGLAGVALRRRS